jgi:hypothetical protein
VSVLEHVEAIFLITCSRCKWDQQSFHDTVEEAAQYFANQGWAEEGPRIYCPRCL